MRKRKKSGSRKTQTNRNFEIMQIMYFFLGILMFSQGGFWLTFDMLFRGTLRVIGRYRPF